MRPSPDGEHKIPLTVKCGSRGEKSSKYQFRAESYVDASGKEGRLHCPVVDRKRDGFGLRVPSTRQ